MKFPLNSPDVEINIHVKNQCKKNEIEKDMKIFFEQIRRPYITCLLLLFFFKI